MSMLDVTVLSLNLRFHNGYDEAFALAKEFSADIICLQECSHDKVLDVVGEYKLASKTQNEPVSLAIYYRIERLKVLNVQSERLRPAVYEKLYGWKIERLLSVRFKLTGDTRELHIASLHATHLVATNSLRRSQILEAFNTFDKETSTPSVLIGDYNYPWFHRRLHKLASKNGYDLYIPEDITFKNKYFKGVFDFISVAHLSHVTMRVLPTKTSDHNAILAYL